MIDLDALEQAAKAATPARGEAAYRQEMTAEIAKWIASAEAAAEAIQRVRDLHVAEKDGTGSVVCGHCMDESEAGFWVWPCRTLAALEGE